MTKCPPALVSTRSGGGAAPLSPAGAGAAAVPNGITMAPAIGRPGARVDYAAADDGRARVVRGLRREHEREGDGEEHQSAVILHN